jgi:hypothetical protein
MSHGVDEKCLLHRPPQDTFRIAIGEARTGAPTSRLRCPPLARSPSEQVPSSRTNPAPSCSRTDLAPSLSRLVCRCQTHTWLALRLRLI